MAVTGCMSAGMCSITEIYQYIFTLKVQDVGKYQNKRHHIQKAVMFIGSYCSKQ